MRRWYAVATLRRGVLAESEPLDEMGQAQADASVIAEKIQPASLCAAMLEAERQKNSWWKDAPYEPETEAAIKNLIGHQRKWERERL